MNDRIEKLLQSEYWIVDILPAQVPKDSPGQYFAVERYWLQPGRMARIKQRHADLVLKLNCYLDLSLDEDPTVNPPPAAVVRAIRTRYVCIRLGDALLVSQPDDACLALYNPDEALLALAGELAAGEGLYLWQPPRE